MKKMKDPRGRKSLGRDGKTIVLAVKLSANELSAFKKLAKAEGMPLSTWIVEPRRRRLRKGR